MRDGKLVRDIEEILRLKPKQATLTIYSQSHRRSNQQANYAIERLIRAGDAHTGTSAGTALTLALSFSRSADE
jgi:hypothetical protein